MLQSPDWFGVIYPHSDFRLQPAALNSPEEVIIERSGLILSILPRGYIQAWGGSFEAQSTGDETKIQFQKNKLPPNAISAVPSYLLTTKDKKLVTTITEEGMQKMLAKVSKFSKGGFAAREQLFAQYVPTGIYNTVVILNNNLTPGVRKSDLGRINFACLNW